jgi:phospholipid-binding lipoprotein MlaA
MIVLAGAATMLLNYAEVVGSHEQTAPSISVAAPIVSDQNSNVDSSASRGGVPEAAKIDMPSTTDAAASGPSKAGEDIVVTAKPRAAPGDSLREVNATSFAVTQATDKAIVRPVALAYQAAVPKPVRSGIRNFLSNLTEPVIFLNFILQLKPGKAAETFGRFAINSTIGGVGLLDVAKRRPFKLPYRRNGFAYTMGYYGVKSGTFLYIPLVGATSVRDVIGLGLDRLIVPFAVGKPFNQPLYTLPSGALTSLDQRAQFDSKLQALKKDKDSFYTATREDYLANRQAEIDALRGKPLAASGTVPESGNSAPD